MSQIGESLQGRDFAYLVVPKVEVSQIGESLQGRDVAYLVTPKVEESQVDTVLQPGEVDDIPVVSGKLCEPLKI